MRSLQVNSYEQAIELVNEYNNGETTYVSESSGYKYESESRYVLVGKKTIYLLSKCKSTNLQGKSREYVTVRKLTNNPFGLMGTEFETFNEAVNHYKNPEIKLALHKFEMGIS